MNTPEEKPPQRSRRFRRHRFKILLVLSLLSIVIADISGTAILQAAGISKPKAQGESVYRYQDPMFHHGLRANVSSVEGVWGGVGHPVFTNSLGCKDASARQINVASTEPRVLLIGDSFTEGVGFAFEKTFAGILAKELAPRGIDVLNAGCSTYSPVIYRRKVRHFLEDKHLRFDHLVVMLDMSDIVDEVKYYRRDEQGNVERRMHGFDDQFKRFIAEHTILMNALRTWLRQSGKAGPAARRQVIGHQRSSWTTDPGLWKTFGEPGLQLADRHLSALQSMVQARGIKMTLVVYPWPDQIIRRERECIQATYWSNWCSQRGVAFVDLFPTFLDAGVATEVIDANFIPFDMHWNEAGHALVARELLQQLSL